MLENENTQDVSMLWTVHTDGSSVQKKSGVEVIITSLEGDILKYEVQLQFPATDNELEYEAILTRLRVARSLKAKNVLLKSLSKLVIGHINGEYEARESRMQRYLKLTNQMIGELERVNFIQVPWSQNSEANEVGRYASSDYRTSLSGLMLEIQKFPNIEEFHTFFIQGNISWTTPILSYLKDGQLPSDSDEARKIKKRATTFTVLNDILYKRGFSLPYLRCIEQDETKYIMEEIHEGICEDHLRASSLVGKIIRASYF